MVRKKQKNGVNEKTERKKGDYVTKVKTSGKMRAEK